MQSFARLNIHIVFSTKHRARLIDPAWADRLYGVIGGTLRTVKSTLLHAGGVEDHVHLLVSLARDLSVSDAARNIKTDSSHWVHTNILELPSFHWQDGYAAFSVSHSQIEIVRSYIARQAEHHRKQTYQDEVRELLRRHELEPDERYMWD